MEVSVDIKKLLKDRGKFKWMAWWLAGKLEEWCQEVGAMNHTQEQWFQEAEDAFKIERKQ